MGNDIWKDFINPKKISLRWVVSIIFLAGVSFAILRGTAFLVDKLVVDLRAEEIARASEDKIMSEKIAVNETRIERNSDDVEKILTSQNNVQSQVSEMRGWLEGKLGE